MSHLIFNLFIESILCFSNATNTNFIFCHSNLFIKLLFKYMKKNHLEIYTTKRNNIYFFKSYIHTNINNLHKFVFFVYSFDSYFARLCLLLFIVMIIFTIVNILYFKFYAKMTKTTHHFFLTKPSKFEFITPSEKQGRVISRF